MKLSQVYTDPELRRKGHRFRYSGDFHIVVTALPNPEFSAFVRDRSRIVSIRGKSGDLDREALDEVTMEAVATHVVMGWDGLEEDDGAVIPYSPSMALEIFRNPEGGDVYRAVQEEASDLSNFRAKVEEQDRGNSKRSSGGKSAGGTKRSDS